MARVTLTQMTMEEFERRREVMVLGYAQSIADNRALSMREARAEAERETAKSLPDGPHSAGQLLRTAWVDGEEVGRIWLSMPGHAVPEMAWIDDVVVDEKHRSHGYGRAIIEAAESELVRLGVQRLGLNVFGDNDVARRLYERMGFEVTQQQRGRLLADRPGPLESPVRLAPIESADFQRRMESLVAAMMTDYGLSAQDAQKRAWLPLPHGVATDDTYVRAVLAGNAEIGWVCYALRHGDRPGRGWLYRLDIDPSFRSQGYGTATVATVEADLAARGVLRMGVGVPGGNAGALRLADRLGYTLMSQQMAKELPSG
jgi:GNAT superfamily N-acetyltransferase